jgi:hypothetical protein
MRPGLTCVLAIVVTACGASAAGAQTPAADALLDRASGYVSRFVEVFSNVVAVEHYVQEVAEEARVGSRTGRSTTARTRRETRSEFLLLKVGGPLEWRPFRDAFQVDGRTIRDRQDRLASLFERPSANSHEQARRIAQESARHNIGLAGRTINTPVLSLLFLQPQVRSRFRFTVEGPDRDSGENVWRVAYREAATPTLIRGITTNEDRDLPSSGRFSIHADTGVVLRADLLLATGSMIARLTTTYQEDAALGVAVPVEMREEYTIAEDARARQRARTITGFARYAEFRRFEVSTETTLSARASDAPSVATLIRRAGEYVARFAQEFSNIVTEEHYVQHVSAGVPSGLLRSGGQRDLRSDLLLLRVGGLVEWQPFRDVFEVGGSPVRDRDERLAKLFSQPTSAILARAEAIALESSRYNIGMVVRTVNTPVHTLLFLRPALQPRFHFELERRDETEGLDVWVVKYEERARPTLIRGDRDADLPASGRFWIDASSGRVLRSELLTFSGAGSARVTTTFRMDADAGVAVPAEMREEYQLQRGRVTAIATYGHYRRFAVSTDSTIGSAPR